MYEENLETVAVGTLAATGLAAVHYLAAATMLLLLGIVLLLRAYRA